MNKLRKTIAVISMVCMLATMFSVPVMANTVITAAKWVSSEYLNPDNPVAQNNPWSVEAKNFPDDLWHSISVNQPNGIETTELFPVMPDGSDPETGYVNQGSEGVDKNGGYAAGGYNAAVNGKHMISGGWNLGNEKFYTGTDKIAKVFTAPATGKVKITAAATMQGTDGMIVATNLTPNEAFSNCEILMTWSIEKNGNELWKKTGTDRVDLESYDTIVMEERTEVLSAGDKIYFIMTSSDWSNRDAQACMWDPVVEYVNVVEPDEDLFVSSKYLQPEAYYTSNPWSVESTNNESGAWEAFTGISATPNTTFSLFPQMPDGVTPDKGFISTGDYDTGWSVQGVNMAVNGKYMIPGAFYTNDNKTASAKMAKVFTATKDGVIKVSAGATMGDGSEGKIVPNRVTDAWENERTWRVEKNGAQIWKKTGADIVNGDLYDAILFEEQVLSVSQGDKIYFIYEPTNWAIRENQACMWDPVVEYISNQKLEISAEYVDKKIVINPITSGLLLDSVGKNDITLVGPRNKVEYVDKAGSSITVTPFYLKPSANYSVIIKNAKYNGYNVSCEAQFTTTAYEDLCYISSEYIKPENGAADPSNPWSAEVNATGKWERFDDLTTPWPNTTEKVGTHVAGFENGGDSTIGAGDIAYEYEYRKRDNVLSGATDLGGMTVSGDFMIPGRTSRDSGEGVSAAVAKAFKAPKGGIIKISSINRLTGDKGILTNAYVGTTPVWGSICEVFVMRNGSTKMESLYKKQSSDTNSLDVLLDEKSKTTSLYFEDIYLQVFEGDKIYFSVSAWDWNKDWLATGVAWDPWITYMGKAIYVDDTSRDKSEYSYPIDHQFEITLTGTPMEEIVADDIVITGGNGNEKVVNFANQGNKLTFKINGLEKEESYNISFKNIAYATKLGNEFYRQTLEFPFTTAGELSLQNGIIAEGGLKNGSNTIKASVVCIDENKIANSDDIIILAAVINSDGSISKVYKNDTPIIGRVTNIDCDITISSGQWVRAWVVDSLANIKPIGGEITDLIQ